MTAISIVDSHNVYPPPAPSFDPVNIAAHHSLFWADPSSGHSYANGTGEDVWHDISGNNRHATNTAFGAQYEPIFRSNVGAANNNKAAFEFDGVDDFFIQAAFTALTQPTGLVVIGAASDRVSGENQGFVGGSTGTNRHDLYTFNDDKYYMHGGNFIGAGVANAAWHCWILEFNGATSKLFMDDPTTPIVTGDAGAHTCTALIIGCINSISLPLDGHIALVGLKASAFTSDERTSYMNGSTTYYGTP
jgi:hypothetical protein